MIRLIDRDIILRQPTIGYTISSVQQLYYTNFLEDELTPEELASRIEPLDHRKSSIKPIFSHTTLLYHPSTNEAEYPALFSEAFRQALEKTNIQSLYCLTDTKRSVFGNLSNTYAPLKKAYKALKQITGNDSTYQGGFEITLDSINEFISILFWIARCDTLSFSLTSDDDSFVAEFCKYGNLHITFYQETAFTNLLSHFLAYGLQEWNEQEYNRFGSSSAIKGRRIKI
ncbi:hypothetical protein [Xanthocytophaga agilis]|uniref:Uncharacterized protein n=1 Tax=Xanthocytophaga agilis TaxID=3048010 RepID=A0AAE3UFC9_9BACT|nr:hypothetical protein [Xanthocytophaga agilis]MDJ1503100.1 hypothetical protein [Xanthocytophaga agilis]